MHRAALAQQGLESRRAAVVEVRRTRGGPEQARRVGALQVAGELVALAIEELTVGCAGINEDEPRRDPLAP
jgi:hypothetical protein